MTRQVIDRIIASRQCTGCGVLKQTERKDLLLRVNKQEKQKPVRNLHKRHLRKRTMAQAGGDRRVIINKAMFHGHVVIRRN